MLNKNPVDSAGNKNNNNKIFILPVETGVRGGMVGECRLDLEEEVEEDEEEE